MGSVALAPTLTPHGRLALVEVADAPYLDPELAQRLRDAFDRGAAMDFFNSERMKWEPHFLLFFLTGENSAHTT